VPLVGSSVVDESGSIVVVGFVVIVVVGSVVIVVDAVVVVGDEVIVMFVVASVPSVPVEELDSSVSAMIPVGPAHPTTTHDAKRSEDLRMSPRYQLAHRAGTCGHPPEARVQSIS
jgi:hypothetical protein